MAFSKVVFNGETLMDVTSDTVSANTLLSGEQATGANGEKVVGTIDNATDSEHGLIKTNSTEGISLNDDGQLEVDGRLGSMEDTTGIYAPKNINPALVKNGSLLITEASGTSLGGKSLAVTTGTGITLKSSAAAGSKKYVVSNTYENRIICAGAVGGVIALDEASAATKTVNVVSVQINSADYTPYSEGSASDIVITTDESINPTSSISSIRLYTDGGKDGGFSNLFVGQCAGGNGGASIAVGQKCFSKSGNACAIVGASIFNQGNGNALFGRMHISKKNRWFMSGTGHDNTDGMTEAGAVFGLWSKITSSTLFAVGNGTASTARSNAFEVLTDGIVLKSPNGTRYKISVDNTGNLTTTAL